MFFTFLCPWNFLMLNNKNTLQPAHPTTFLWRQAAPGYALNCWFAVLRPCAARA